MPGGRDGAGGAPPAGAPPRRQVHPFPARMAPGLVLDLMKGQGKSLRVLDPMAGSGTVLAVARDSGHTATGLDADPLAVLIAGVWTTPVSHRSLRRSAARVLEEARLECEERGTIDACPRNADAETMRFARFWFDPTARRQLASLSAAIRRVRSRAVRNALWCAFSRLVITKQAGASLAMDLAHSRPHKAFDRAPALPFTRFESAVERVAAGCVDLADGGGGVAADVRLGDARRTGMPDGSADMVITSPPYLNAIDYMRCSKFSLVWMGHTVKDLRSIRSAAIGTEVGMYERAGDAERIVSKMGLGNRLPSRARAILTRYVHDMGLVVGETARVLAGGGTAAYVMGENTVRGTFVRNSRIVEMLAAASGLKVVSRRSRCLPPSSRYLPPPPPQSSPPRPSRPGSLDGRMRREVVIEMRR